MKYRYTALTLVLICVAATAAQAAGDKKKEPQQQAQQQPAPDNDKVNVDSIKEKYWARGDESEVGVVQNRLYTKAHKLELGVFGGIVSSDPFLTINAAGLSVGYHLSEYLAIHAFGWKDFVGPSNALLTFQETRGATTNTNEPRFFFGVEAAVSPIYGKLSVAGLAIIHYDLHLLGGVGVTNTESGNYPTPLVGIGQQIYLTNSFSLRVDYRLMPYKESIREKVIPTKLGQTVDTRWNYSNAVTFGFTYLFDLPGGKKK